MINICPYCNELLKSENFGSFLPNSQRYYCNCLNSKYYLHRLVDFAITICNNQVVFYRFPKIQIYKDDLALISNKNQNSTLIYNSNNFFMNVIKFDRYFDCELNLEAAKQLAKRLLKLKVLA